MSTPDHYAVLGVSPDAEDVVIKAAYRALAQRYHPDKNTGDPAYSRQRMSELNEAYRILGDPKLRAEYDKTRSPQSGHAYQQEEPPEQREAFDAALAEMEGRWAIAVSIYPDLKDYRGSLARMSSSLAFGYVAGMLDSKAFDRRAEIAAKLERNFLGRFFGSDPKVIAYAKELISSGDRKAALVLNRLVEVMGSGVDSKILIRKTEEARGNIDFGQKASQEINSKPSLFYKDLGLFWFFLWRVGAFIFILAVAVHWFLYEFDIGRSVDIVLLKPVMINYLAAFILLIPRVLRLELTQQVEYDCKIVWQLLLKDAAIIFIIYGSLMLLLACGWQFGIFRTDEWVVGLLLVKASCLITVPAYLTFKVNERGPT